MPGENQQDLDTRLHLAVVAGDLDKTLEYLNAGANPEAPNDDGTTLISFISEFRDTISQKEKNRQLQISLMAQCSDQARRALVQVWLEIGANPNSSEKNGYSAVITCIQNEHVEFLKLLKKFKADFNLPIPYGENRGVTPLHYAILAERNATIVPELIRLGADPNKLIKSGSAKGGRPLHSAIISNNFPAFQSLIKHGADLSLKSVKGETAIDIALRMMRGVFIKYLVCDVPKLIDTHILQVLSALVVASNKEITFLPGQDFADKLAKTCNPMLPGPEPSEPSTTSLPNPILILALLLMAGYFYISIRSLIDNFKFYRRLDRERALADRPKVIPVRPRVMRVDKKQEQNDSKGEIKSEIKSHDEIKANIMALKQKILNAQRNFFDVHTKFKKLSQQEKSQFLESWIDNILKYPSIEVLEGNITRLRSDCVELEINCTISKSGAAKTADELDALNKNQVDLEIEFAATEKIISAFEKEYRIFKEGSDISASNISQTHRKRAKTSNSGNPASRGAGMRSLGGESHTSSATPKEQTAATESKPQSHSQLLKLKKSAGVGKVTVESKRTAPTATDSTASDGKVIAELPKVVSVADTAASSLFAHGLFGMSNTNTRTGVGRAVGAGAAASGAQSAPAFRLFG